ncbi:MAG: 30S ribosomal protein THX [Bacteroidota bacterium]
MGKGDIKTRRGKISNGSYGKTRTKKKAKVVEKVKAKSKSKKK